MGLLDSIFNHFSASQMAQKNFENSIALQNHQYRLNRKAIREYYTNNRYSLENAGYNPLLALPGSSAQGFSASASMGSAPGQGSGIGTDEANLVNSALSAREQRKVAKQQVEQSKEQTKSLQLDNKKKELELKTSPKNIIVDELEGKPLPNFIRNGIKSLKSKGIDITPNSAQAVQSKGRPVIKLHDGKTYIQKGVPKSVVKNFNDSTSATSALDKLPRYPDIGVFKHREGKKVKNYKNKPPKNFPSGM